ncbi:MAG: hypothetical protein ACREP2_15170, partial [Rhodanobacteraceae bacterium]
MRVVAFATILLLATGVARADSLQSLQALQDAAVQAVRKAAPVGARVVAEAERLDPRLRLAACAGELQVTAPDLRRGASRVSVAVSCAIGQSWSVRV